MKKKVLLIGSLFAAGLLFSCNGEGNNNSEQTPTLPSSQEHVHNYETEVILPTCEEEGYTIYTCSSCNDSYIGEKVGALGHDLITESKKAATCEEKGYEAYEHCSRCDYTTYQEIPALGHNYETEITASTCVSEGYTTFTCSNCNDQYVDNYTPFAEHDLQHHDGKAATCTEDGFYSYDTCKNCDYTTYQVDTAVGHDYFLKTISPTCEEQGYDLKGCYRCDFEEKFNYTEPYGHNIYDVIGKGATCTEVGYESYQFCGNCNYTTYQEIPKLPHVPNGECVQVDEIYHHENCRDCGAVLENENHVLELGICECGFNYSNDYLTFRYDEKEDIHYLVSCSKEAEYIYIPDYVDVISNKAFEYCEKLKYVYIPEGVIEIKDGAFNHCTSLTSIEIPGSCVNLGMYITSQSGVETIILNEGIVSVYNHTFEGTENLKAIYLPSTIKEFGYRNISQDTKKMLESIYYKGDVESFFNIDIHNELTSLLVAVSTLYVYNEDLEEYETVKTLTVPTSVTEIKPYKYQGLRQVEEVILHDGIVEIGDRSFADCESLEKINIPTTVERIGYAAFKNTNFKSLALPFIGESRTPSKSENRVLSYIFGITISGYSYDTFYTDCTEPLEEVIIYDGITYLPRHAFGNMVNLKTVVLPDTLSGEIAFEGLFANKESIEGNVYDKGIYLPSHTNPYFMFIRPTSLDITSLVIHKDVEYIYLFGLEGCDKLETLKTPFVATFKVSSSYIPSYSTTVIGQKALFNQTELVLKEVTLYGLEHAYGLNYFNTIETIIIEDAKLISEMGESSAKKVVLPEGLEEIGNACFFGSYSLVDINIPSSVLRIGSTAFYGCTSLEELEIPEGVKEIGSLAFENCESIKTITLPNSLETLGEGLFKDCTNLQEITTPFLGESKDSETTNTLSYFLGYVYEDDSTIHIDYYKNQFPNLKKVTLTNIEYLSYQAFYEALTLEEIVLPDTLKFVGSSAFLKCSATKITIPFVGCMADYDYTNKGYNKLSALMFSNIRFESPLEELVILNAETIYENGLDLTNVSAPYLKKITIVGSINEIKENGIVGWDNIELFVENGCHYISTTTNPYEVLVKVDSETTQVTVNETTKHILPNCFDDATFNTLRLSAQQLPSLSAYDFSFVSNLVITGGSIDEAIQANFSGVTNLTLENVTSYCDGAFANLTSLETISFDNTLTMFGDKAFEGLSSFNKVEYNGNYEDWLNISFNSLTSTPVYYSRNITINDQTITEVRNSTFISLQSYTFAGWDSINKVIVDNPYGSLRSNVFETCANITSYEGPSNYLDKFDCSKLEEVYLTGNEISSGSIPSTLTSLKQLTIDESITHFAYNTFASVTNIDKLVYTGTLASWLEINFDNIGAAPHNISKNLYINDEQIASVNCAELGITSIPRCAFAGLSTITEIDLTGVIEINEYAFAGTGITSIVIPEGVTRLYDGTFENCELLTSVNLGEGLQVCDTNTFKNCYEIDYVYFGKSYDTLYVGIFKESSIKDIEVSSENEYHMMLEGCMVTKEEKSLELMEEGVNAIPEGVKNISFDVFGKGDEIKELVIPSSVEFIGYGALRGLNNIESITLSSLAGRTYFAELFDIVPESLAEVNIKNIETIPFNYFQNCTTIKVVNLSNDVKEIQFGAFGGCTSLEYVTLPEEIDSLPALLFKDCTSLKEIVLPGVETIATSSFENCTSLETVVINEGTKEIAMIAFGGCSSLTTIVFPSTLEIINETALKGCTSLKEITTPILGEYRNSEGAAGLQETIGCWFGREQIENTYAVTAVHRYSENTFYVPYSLTTINFTGEKIPGDALKGCVSVTELNILGDLNTIGEEAFSGSSISVIVIDSEEVTIWDNAFAGMDSLQTVYNNSNNVFKNGEISTEYIACSATNIYNKGEWEYIEGIPTPIA